MTTSKLLILFSGIVAEVFLPGSARSLTSWDALQRLVFQMSEPSCRARSFEGCCTGPYSSCCIPVSPNRHCCCDQYCHTAGDCCGDAEEVGCFAAGSSPAPPSEVIPTTSSPQLPEPANICRALTGQPGCCDPLNDNCLTTNGTSGHCNCDRDCHRRHDCCPGIEENGCYAQTCAGKGYNTENCCGTNANCPLRRSASPQDLCYCDGGCTSSSGNNHECCSDNIQCTDEAQQISAMLENVENKLEVMQTRLSRDKMAAAFWRRYNQMNRKQRLHKRRIKTM